MPEFPALDETQHPNARAGLNRRHPKHDTDTHGTRTRDRQTLRKQGAFLAAYGGCGRIDLSAKAAGIARETHYLWKRTDPEYLEAFGLAEELASATVLDEATRRGRDGWDEPVTVAGEKVLVRKYSDRLLERLLEAKFPLIFRSNLAHRQVDAKDKDRPLFDIAELDKLMRAADERDKEAAFPVAKPSPVLTPDPMQPEGGE